jgi:hypothetical protein
MEKNTLFQICDGRISLREFMGDKGYILRLRTSPKKGFTLSEGESEVTTLKYKELFDTAPENNEDIRDRGLQSLICQLRGVKFPTLKEKEVKTRLRQLIAEKSNYQNEIDQYIK